MIEINVKTLDSKTHTFQVDENITIKDFKELIAPTVNIPSATQRIIYCGKVLTDERKLTDCDLASKTVHLVQRAPHSRLDNPPPPQPPPQPNAPTGQQPGQPNQFTHGPFIRFGIPTVQPGVRPDNSYLLGAFTFPQGTFDPGSFQQVVQDFVLANLGDFARNATVMSRSSDDGSSVDVHINLGQLPLPNGVQVNIRVDQVPQVLRNAGQSVNGDDPNAEPQTISAPQVTPNDSINATPSESSNPSPQPPPVEEPRSPQPPPPPSTDESKSP